MISRKEAENALIASFMERKAERGPCWTHRGIISTEDATAGLWRYPN